MIVPILPGSQSVSQSVGQSVNHCTRHGQRNKTTCIECNFIGGMARHLSKLSNKSIHRGPCPAVPSSGRLGTQPSRSEVRNECPLEESEIPVT